MGTDDGPDNTRPRHRVTVDAFLMMRFPVSRAQYQEFLDATSCPAPSCWSVSHLSDERQPACGVSWHDACAFASWRGGRLPTEAEREWASRGGRMDAAFPWGDEVREVPWGPSGGPPLLGDGEPNGFGLFHMADGVHEWCLDWYDSRWYAVSGADNPRGPENGTRRAARGGSWRHQIRVTACTARSSLPPHYQYEDFGFRLVDSPPHRV